MTRVYRISKVPGVDDVLESIEAIGACACDHGPGRYDVGEHAVDPFPETNFSVRASGTLIHQPDSAIALKPCFFDVPVPAENS